MKPHVLFLPSWYATRENPVLGAFFHDQAVAASAAGVRVGIAFVDLKSLARVNARSLLSHRWAVTMQREGGVETIRTAGWRLPTAKAATETLWIHQTVRLVKRYSEVYGRPDLVHAHCVHNAGRAAVAVKEQLGIPFMITEHFSGYLRGLMDDERTEQARRVLAAASRIVAVSDTLAVAVRSLAGGRVVEVIPNLVDTEFYTPPPRPRPTKAFGFFFVGFLTPVKRVDLLLRAFQRVAERRAEVSLEIGGDGFQRAELERLARSLGLADRVQFHGMLERDQVRDALWRSHAYVSTSDVETFGVSLIEAMATGLPVVATRSGGPGEFVTPDTGHLVPTGDVEALAEAMDSVFQNRLCWAQRAHDIRGHVAGRFSHTAIGESLARRYRDCIASSS